MGNTTARPNATDQRQQSDRGKENKLLTFQDRRAPDWRRAADRMQRAGRPVTALLFNNEAERMEELEAETSR